MAKTGLSFNVEACDNGYIVYAHSDEGSLNEKHVAKTLAGVMRIIKHVQVKEAIAPSAAPAPTPRPTTAVPIRGMPDMKKLEDLIRSEWMGYGKPIKLLDREPEPF